MAEYITKEDAIQIFEWGEADVIEDYGDGCNFGFSRGIIKSAINAIPSAEAVSLHDIYRVIAGHSYYHGGSILAALSCIAEGKEVDSVRPADVAPVVHARWITRNDKGIISMTHPYMCSRCWRVEMNKEPYCNCGAKMDGG